MYVCLVIDSSSHKWVDCNINVMTFFSISDLTSINGDGAAQPVPSPAEQQESSSSHQTHDSEGASWPAPFEMPSSVSEDPSASSQVCQSLDDDSVNELT